MGKYLLLLSVIIFSGHAAQLRFIGEVTFNSKTTFKETTVGGLSGLTYDSANNQLLAISDNRQNPRYYRYQLKLDEKIFTLTPTDVIFFKNQQNKPFDIDSLDLEGITLTKNQTLLVCSEGDYSNPVKVIPQLLEFNLTGTLIKKHSIQRKYIPTHDAAGIQDNKGFETLSITPDQRTVIIATENSLKQDFGQREITPIRLIYHDEQLQPNREYAYLIDKKYGLVDLIAFNTEHLITLERYWDKETKKNSIRIFDVKLSENSTNVINLPSLNAGRWNAVTKELLLDLDSIVQQLAGKRLDNFEGIVTGPKLKNGNDSLIIVSDNNFSIFQQTIFLAFELIQ